MSDTAPTPPPTPMMAQYIEIKAANPGSLLFYRMGDFYELFFGDAEIAARALGIALTKRGKHLGEDIPMCGVPVHAADNYLQKLISLGHRVAVCEQMENPAEAKKRGSKSVVRRDVIRLVTPGTITEERLLEPGRSSALATIARVRDDWAVAVVDISTGSFRVAATDEAQLSAVLARFDASEIVLPEALEDDETLANALSLSSAAIQTHANHAFDSSRAEDAISGFFKVASTEAFGAFNRAELAALSGAISYVKATQKDAQPSLIPPRQDGMGDHMAIDAATRANLELVRRLDGGRDGTLLTSVDRTVSGLGARLLAERIMAPSTLPEEIKDRHEDVAALLAAPRQREGLRKVLRGAADIPRALSRLSLGRGGPRDLAALAVGLRAADEACIALEKYGESRRLDHHIAICAGIPQALADLLAAALDDDLPLLARDGSFIKPGFDEALDEQRKLSRDARGIIAELQARYAQETGVKGLKVRHNNVLGYFIEVTALNAAALQADQAQFIHRQTMASAMRFTTTELAELESRIADAGGKALQIELDHFDRLLGASLDETDALQNIAAALAELDVASALAELAEEQGYCRPLIDTSLAFHITAGRHPVVEQALRKEAAHPFIANDCSLGEETSEAGDIRLLTGPNMGGKSTYLRQNALIAILAQSGSFVPAGSAHIGIVDALFSRVGAADDLARGRSTFMVEMVETAAILNRAGQNALVILDEIGRGTATFDGLSIAWAALEHLHEVNGCRTLFATHFHELTALSTKLDRMANLTMRVKEWKGDVVFLHEVGEGSADRSYGIQVARLAGLPGSVVERAKAVLDQLEKGARETGADRLIDDLPLFSASALQQPAKPAENSALNEALNELSPDTMSPMQALEALYRLKDLAPPKN